jgi:lysophospholipase L1-like esterase
MRWLLSCLVCLFIGSSSAWPVCAVSGVRVQLFGDSTQLGWDGVTRRMAKATPDVLLQRILDARLGPGVAVVANRSVSGTTAVQLAEGTDGLNLPWPQSVDADIVVVNHGINDMRVGNSLAAYRAALETLAKTDAVVIFETPNRTTWPRVDAFVPVMREVAAAHGVPVADVYAYSQGFQMLDWAHPTAEQYANIVADVLAPVVVSQVCHRASSAAEIAAMSAPLRPAAPV